MSVAGRKRNTIYKLLSPTKPEQIHDNSAQDKTKIGCAKLKTEIRARKEQLQTIRLRAEMALYIHELVDKYAKLNIRQIKI